ncbi:MAG TPA: hypothetical protein VGB37_14490 [Candidatus Lokiarchaeia archaeon]
MEKDSDKYRDYNLEKHYRSLVQFVLILIFMLLILILVFIVFIPIKVPHAMYDPSYIIGFIFTLLFIGLSICGIIFSYEGIKKA